MCVFLALAAAAFLGGCGRKEAGAEELFAGVFETAKETDAETESRMQMQGSGLDAGTETETEMDPGAAAPDYYVYVCGAVKEPGVYCMKKGERLFEAIAAAGGLLESACGDYVNQAAEVSDGMKLWIPSNEEAAQMGVRFPGSLEASAGENGSDHLVNINTASMETLCSLSGIGEAKAQAIIAYRESCGGFSKKEDIMNVAGIKQSGYEKIKDRICVG